MASGYLGVPGGVLPSVVVAIAGWTGSSLKPLTSHMGFLFGLVAVCFLAPCLAGLAHELGHVIAGWLVGFQFRLLVFGPMRLERGASGRVRARLNQDPALFGGIACSLPTDNRDLIKRFAWFVAGGPVMSLAFAALLVLPLVFARGWFGLFTWFALGLTALCSAALDSLRPSRWP
jgi:hypothetical protein